MSREFGERERDERPDDQTDELEELRDHIKEQYDESGDEKGEEHPRGPEAEDKGDQSSEQDSDHPEETVESVEEDAVPSTEAPEAPREQRGTEVAERPESGSEDDRDEELEQLRERVNERYEETAGEDHQDGVQSSGGNGNNERESLELESTHDERPPDNPFESDDQQHEEAHQERPETGGETREDEETLLESRSEKGSDDRLAHTGELDGDGPGTDGRENGINRDAGESGNDTVPGATSDGEEKDGEESEAPLMRDSDSLDMAWKDDDETVAVLQDEARWGRTLDDENQRDLGFVEAGLSPQNDEKETPIEAEEIVTVPTVEKETPTSKDEESDEPHQSDTPTGPDDPGGRWGINSGIHGEPRVANQDQLDGGKTFDLSQDVNHTNWELRETREAPQESSEQNLVRATNAVEGGWTPNPADSGAYQSEATKELKGRVDSPALPEDFEAVGKAQEHGRNLAPDTAEASPARGGASSEGDVRQDREGGYPPSRVGQEKNLGGTTSLESAKSDTGVDRGTEKEPNHLEHGNAVEEPTKHDKAEAASQSSTSPETPLVLKTNEIPTDIISAKNLLGSDVADGKEERGISGELTLEGRARTNDQLDQTDVRTISATNYGKGFSLVLRRSEIPAHEGNDRLELTVARPSSPEQQFTLYARDDQTSRDVHFVVTQLNPEKGERFLAKSLRKYGMDELAEDYNQNKPTGLRNTSLIPNGNGVSIKVDGVEVSLKEARLSAYGRKIMLQAELPHEFQTGNPKVNEIRVSKAGDGFEIGLADGSRATSEFGLANGSRVASMRREGDTLMFDYERTQAPIPVSLEGFRGRRGGEINLSKVEDRAWLGALVVGEGSSFAHTPKGGTTGFPELVVAMQDKDAVEKAANLMGVRMSVGALSEASGRRSWRAAAVGGRAIAILELLRPFMTPTKIKQAEAAIDKARETGFVTNAEMRERQKSRLMDELTSKPGSSTRELGIELGIGHSYALKYLNELKSEGKVLDTKGGTPRRTRLHWFIRTSTPA